MCPPSHTHNRYHMHDKSACSGACVVCVICASCLVVLCVHMLLNGIYVLFMIPMHHVFINNVRCCIEEWTQMY